MAGVKKIELQKKARQLVVDFNDGRRVMISFSDLRARSPSAENRAQPAAANPDIDIVSLQPVGNYAVRPIFQTAIKAAFILGIRCALWAM